MDSILNVESLLIKNNKIKLNKVSVILTLLFYFTFLTFIMMNKFEDFSDFFFLIYRVSNHRFKAKVQDKNTR